MKKKTRSIASAMFYYPKNAYMADENVIVKIDEWISDSNISMKIKKGNFFIYPVYFLAFKPVSLEKGKQETVKSNKRKDK